MSIKRARRLRTKATDAERILWRQLRAFKHDGLHFRRQVPLGSYVADFACHRAKIIIKLDGGQHGEEQRRRHDAERTTFLESEGYRVMRFWNLEILSNLDRVAEFIFAEAHARLHPPPDPPAR